MSFVTEECVDAIAQRKCASDVEMSVRVKVINS